MKRASAIVHDGTIPKISIFYGDSLPQRRIRFGGTMQSAMIPADHQPGDRVRASRQGNPG
jgi:hypothetical protein